MTNGFMIVLVASWVGLGLRIGWYAGGAVEELFERLTARLRRWARSAS